MRRAFNLAAAVSFAFMLALVALWVHSFWQCDTIERREYRPSGMWRVELSSNRGLLRADVYQFATTTAYASLAPGEIRWHFSSDPTRIDFEGFWGIGWETLTFSLWTLQCLTVPHWLFVLACALLPLAWLHRRRRIARRRTSQRCVTCGYNLRATPDRCPECGTVVAARIVEAVA